MSTNFQLKQLKLKLDIVEKPENRVHKLTDSNVFLGTREFVLSEAKMKNDQLVIYDY